jgi:hypothetical protein
MIGMQDTTTAFVAAFGDEPNPPNLDLEMPAYSRRELPRKITALTDEKAVTRVPTRRWTILRVLPRPQESTPPLAQEKAPPPVRAGAAVLRR